MSERACIWAWVLIIPSSLHFLLQLFLASKIVASFSLGGYVELALFLVEAFELTALEEIEQRGTTETVETDTLVSVEDGFILETLQLGEDLGC